MRSTDNPLSVDSWADRPLAGGVANLDGAQQRCHVIDVRVQVELHTRGGPDVYERGHRAVTVDVGVGDDTFLAEHGAERNLVVSWSNVEVPVHQQEYRSDQHNRATTNARTRHVVVGEDGEEEHDGSHDHKEPAEDREDLNHSAPIEVILGTVGVLSDPPPKGDDK